ncbi:ABC transporter C family member 3 [Cytospora mali]|uniref:ABC transporter C family member 3 n=1 Tax=Cytospora mali TaxID=578113 RepID=A0A194UPV9_CYTMA|nr:ABC transporter C family member 3 [Valsa mali var. pyri (nom. inval.)]
MALGSGIDRMCSIRSMDDWGPFAHSLHCGNLSFTLLFQEIAMAIPPASCALLLALLRIAFLVRQPTTTQRTVWYSLKLGTLLVVAALELSQVCVVASHSVPKTRASLAAAIIYLVSTVVFVCLSELEHTRSPRPSYILSTYFLVSCILDIIRARALWIIADAKLAAALFTATLMMRALVLFLESSPKTHALKAQYKGAPPESTNGIFSLFLLWWLNPLLRLGYRSDLSLTSLLRLGSHMSSEVLFRGMSAQWARAQQEKRHSLFLSLIRQHKRTVLAGALIRLCLTAFTFSQPFLVQGLLNYVKQGSSDTPAEGTWLIVAYAAVYTGIAICQAGYMYQTERLIVMIRGGLISMLYHDMLNMDTMKASKSSPVALISMDMEKIATGLQTVHHTWAGLLEVALAIWLLERQLGLAVLGSIFVCFACIFAGAFVAWLGGNRQARWMRASQRRVDVTTTMLSRFKSVRLAGYADILSVHISKLRDREVVISKEFRKCLLAMVTLSYASNIAAPILGIGVYALAPSIRGSAAFDASKVFSSLSIYTLLGQATTTFIQAALGLMSAVSCIERFRQNIPEGWNDRRLARRPSPSIQEERYSFDRSSDRRNLTTDPKPLWSKPTEEEQPESSRSNFTSLHDVETGKMNEPGPSGTGYELITFEPIPGTASKASTCVVAHKLTVGWPDNEQVISNLSFTIKRFRFTVITGGMGCGKSTLLDAILGQALISSGMLASSFTLAAYCSQTPWLLNQTIRQNVLGVCNYDSSWYATVLKACALEQDVQNMSAGDQSIVGSEGVRLSGGQRKRLPDARKHRPVSSRGSTSEEHGNSDFPEEDEIANSTLQGVEIPHARDSRSRSDMKVYGYYISKIGIMKFLAFLACCIGQVLGFYLPQIWIALWIEADDSSSGGLSSATYVGVYAMFGTVALLSLISGGTLLMLRIVPKTARSLHAALLSAVARAPVSYVVGKDAGEIVNRQDLMINDTDVPIATSMTIFACLSCIIQAIFLCISAPRIAAGIPLFLGTFYIIQKFYLQTSRQLRVLDIEAKAPLISHFLDTLRGLTTIRAYGAGAVHENHLFEMLDLSQRPFYLLYCIQIWLGLVIELCVAAVAVVLVGITVGVRNSPTAEFLGVSLLSIVSFAVNLDDLVRNWTSLETAIQAIDRIQSFSLNTPSEEKPGEDYLPPDEWPQEGQVEFRNVTAAYDTHTVLRDVSFTIQGGQKIGICGRTGGGKSSLLATLSRVIDLEHGSILIDGVDIATVPRRLLRSKVLNVPQEPFVTPGTIRENIDPLNMLSDDELVGILKDVCLWDALEGGDDGGDVNERLEADANKTSFSAGQLQLLSLARAMVQRGKIIVMDEVASNLDAETDELIRRIIRTKFYHHTVISVAHSAENLVDCDKVLVVDQGWAAEFDEPGKLAAQPESKFKQINISNVTVLPLDVGDTASVAAAARAVADSGRGLHVLVNNAGGGYVQPVLDIDIAAAQRLHDVNLWGPLRTIQAFADLLIASRGRIVNVSSSAAVINSPWMSTYAASKAALNTLSETLRLELAPFGVSVVTIMPGVIDSKLHVNDAAAFDMPPLSRYSAIKGMIASCARGELIPKDSLSAEKFAELVVDDVIGTGKGGLVSKGPYAAMIRKIGQWAPTWLADYILSQNQGLKELTQKLEQDNSV